MSIIIPGQKVDVSRIADGIYVGAAYNNPWLPNEITDVVALCPPSEGVFQWNRPLRSHVTYPLDDIDDKTSGVDKESLAALGDWVNSRVAYKEGNVLIHCSHGANRSCLVAAIALIRGGMDPERAYELLQRRRGSFVLFNPYFLDMVLDWHKTW